MNYNMSRHLVSAQFWCRSAWIDTSVIWSFVLWGLINEVYVITMANSSTCRTQFQTRKHKFKQFLANWHGTLTKENHLPGCTVYKFPAPGKKIIITLGSPVVAYHSALHPKYPAVKTCHEKLTNSRSSREGVCLRFVSVYVYACICVCHTFTICEPKFHDQQGVRLCSVVTCFKRRSAWNLKCWYKWRDCSTTCSVA